MQEATSIRILEKDNNRRGDIFGRLMADLFVALGYEYPRLNIHKSGRELDLSAEHRLEPRRAIAECKATAAPIGGDDLNKFVGVLDVEQGDNSPVNGYFISLSGFKETAIEQEKQRRRKIITLTGAQVVGELVRGRIIVAAARATELAGRHCASLGDLILDQEVELLAHERGWIWAIYYTQGKARTHFALIHSDGTPLAYALADEVITADRDCGGDLYKLRCLNPMPPPSDDANHRVAEALAAYHQYISNECGFIQLDGLPADSDVGSRRLRLENLFVPLHLDVEDARYGFIVDAAGELAESTEVYEERDERVVKNRLPVGKVISRHARIALLAPPGGGKSTLIKRLAVAYSDPVRRGQIIDGLPERDWLPIFLRCRELRGLARGSFAELIRAISERETVRPHTTAFRAYVDRALLSGNILLLVDGLDEISDPGDRAAFVCTLRTALQAYPDIAIVVTSREAGFRHVATHLASVCAKTTLSAFNESDIRRLCVAWHREVVGDTEKVRADAEQLATTITQNERIKGLAVNPLLLTTLLLVKRWVGSLPTRRSVLYGKAVEVLLMTWNTEGHEPIPEEEALPQLCYVASAMMLDGAQKISRPRLAAQLQQSRDFLPTELGYVKGTVDEFINRVEDRSSLLTMSGLDVEDGRLVEFFEFRHLTFQEFLTARAMVEGWHPGRREEDTLVSVLEPHFDEERWREVIPLAAVLGGKATEGLIQKLTEKVKAGKGSVSGPAPTVFQVLVNCLADEASARPETIRAAARAIVHQGTYLITTRAATRMLLRGRYGADLRAEAGHAFLTEMQNLASLGDALAEAVVTQILDTEDAMGYEHARDRLVELLNKPEEVSRCEGACGIGRISQTYRPRQGEATHAMVMRHFAGVWMTLVAMLEGTTAERLSASYAIEGLYTAGLSSPPVDLDVFGPLFKVWRGGGNSVMCRLAVRALAAHPIIARDERSQHVFISNSDVEGLLHQYDKLEEAHEKLVVLILAWYLRVLPDTEIRDKALALQQEQKHFIHSDRLTELIRHIE